MTRTSTNAMDEPSNFQIKLREEFSKCRSMISSDLGEHLSQLQAKLDANMARLNSSLESKFEEMLKAINRNQTIREILDPSIDSSLEMVAANPIDGEMSKVYELSDSQRSGGCESEIEQYFVEEKPNSTPVEAIKETYVGVAIMEEEIGIKQVSWTQHELESLPVHESVTEDFEVGNLLAGELRQQYPLILEGPEAAHNLFDKMPSSPSRMQKEGNITDNVQVAMGVKGLRDSLFPDTVLCLYELWASNAINRMCLFWVYAIELEAYECKCIISCNDIKEMFTFDPGGFSLPQMCCDPFGINKEQWDYYSVTIMAPRNKYCLIGSNCFYVFSSGIKDLIVVRIDSGNHEDDFTTVGAKAVFKGVNLNFSMESILAYLAHCELDSLCPVVGLFIGNKVLCISTISIKKSFQNQHLDILSEVFKEGIDQNEENVDKRGVWLPLIHLQPVLGSDGEGTVYGSANGSPRTRFEESTSKLKAVLSQNAIDYTEHKVFDETSQSFRASLTTIAAIMNQGRCFQWLFTDSDAMFLFDPGGCSLSQMGSSCSLLSAWDWNDFFYHSWGDEFGLTARIIFSVFEHLVSIGVIGIDVQSYVWEPGQYMPPYILEDKDVVKRNGIGVRLALT